MLIRIFTVFILCAVLEVTPATAAAMVQPTAGTLYVTQNGNGYLPVIGPTEVEPGTVVMVSPGGLANMTYSDGCVVPIQPGSVFTVESVSPCASPYGPRPEPEWIVQNPGTTPWIFAGGALVLAGVGIGIYYAVSASP